MAAFRSTFGGPHLCDNKIRVKREVAESVILENVKSQLLSDDTVAYVTKQFQVALRDLEVKPKDADILAGKLQTIDRKLAKLAEAIEAVGISDTLANRLAKLEKDKAETEVALKEAKQVAAAAKFRTDVLTTLVERWRELVNGIESLAENAHATVEDVEVARMHLHALLGTVTLKPHQGVLWAYPTPKAKGLVETRPLHINTQKLVAGAGFEPATFGL